MSAIADLVHQRSSSTGAGDLTLFDIGGRQGFADAFGVGGTENVFWYFIMNNATAEWEVGSGHCSDAVTLVRDTIIASSNSNAAVNFSAGVKDITNDIPATFQQALLNVQRLMGLVDPTAAGFSGGNITLDVADGNKLYFTRTMAGDETLLTPANMPIGSTATLLVDPTDVPGTAASVSTASKGQLTSGSSWNITLPSGIVAGDLLVVVVSMDGVPAISINTGTSGFNWRNMGQSANGSTVTSAMFWKIAEGSDALAITTSATEEGTFYCYRISGGHVLGDVSAATGNGSSTNGVPPSLTPPGGTRNYLLITALATDARVVASGAPSGYGGLDTQVAATSGGASISVATRTASVSSESPGAFTNGSEQWVTWTIAVGPRRNYTLSFSGDFVEPTPFVVAESAINIQRLGASRYAAQVSWSAAA